MTALLAILFLAMIAAPCVIALRSAPKSDEDGEIEVAVSSEEVPLPAGVPAPLPATPAPAAPTAAPAFAAYGPVAASYTAAPEPAYREARDLFEPVRRRGTISLQMMAEEAEREALVAGEWALKAHWAALDAAARAAAIRADAAAEVAALAGKAAEEAIRAAEAEFGEGFLRETHPPSNYPGSRGDRRAA